MTLLFLKTITDFFQRNADYLKTAVLKTFRSLVLATKWFSAEARNTYYFLICGTYRNLLEQESFDTENRIFTLGCMDATVAATHLLFAHVLISIYDSIHGRDLRDEGYEILAHPYKVTRDNAGQFSNLMNRIRHTDFRKFSKVLNKDLKKYDFSIERLAPAVLEFEQKSRASEKR